VPRKVRELWSEAAVGRGLAGRITRKDRLRRRPRLRAQVERALDRL
jgi:hypothetical protein